MAARLPPQQQGATSHKLRRRSSGAEAALDCLAPRLQD
jgi:hypothetical protein